ncbi:MAG: gamma-glutamyltransferase family protein [Alphaproteobacteria bacterium]
MFKFWKHAAWPAAAVLAVTAVLGEFGDARAQTEGETPAAEPETRLGGGDRLTGRKFATRSPVLGRNGMAATAQPLASQIAIDILKKGGSAVDAAIAANAALGLMEPTGNGIGGDLFAIVWDPKTGRLYGLNASGRSPKGRSLAELKQKLGERTSIPPVGSLPVTVPGTVDGWFELHEKFGRLDMEDVLAPAIHYAREGFPVTQLIAFYWERNMRAFQRIAQGEDPPEAVAAATTPEAAQNLPSALQPFLEEVENARRTYLIDGKPPVQGQIFKNPDLARTYALLAEEGRDAFYEGEIARTIDAYMKRIGGDLRFEDFAAHESEWVTPVSVNYRGYDVYELPPNTQGIAALQMLQILKGYDLKAMGEGSAGAIHAMVEAKRLAFEDRAKYYADPAFARIPVGGLISEEYGDELRRQIDPARARQDVRTADPVLENGDTTYLTVADSNGMMVSLIQSNFRGMGSGLVPDGLGFMLQDRGELFSLEEGHANVYAPGKRPFHTIIPAFVMKDGKPLMSFGLMGGAMQPQGHVQVLTNMIDFGMNVQEAGDAARWRHSGSTEPTGSWQAGPGVLNVETGIAPEVRARLEEMGHVVEQTERGYGGYQAIWRDPETGVYRGASEMRKDGAAIGY